MHKCKESTHTHGCPLLTSLDCTSLYKCNNQKSKVQLLVIFLNTHSPHLTLSPQCSTSTCTEPILGLDLPRADNSQRSSLIMELYYTKYYRYAIQKIRQITSLVTYFLRSVCHIDAAYVHPFFKQLM